MVEGIIAVVIVLILMLLNMPVAFAFLIVGATGYAIHQGIDRTISLVAITANAQLTNYVLLTIPLFALMGILAGGSGIARDLFNMSNKWIGSKKGGLGMATFLTCSLFAACTGSSYAMCATMGKIAEPELRRLGYNPSLSAAIIAAGGTLGILIPPSTPMIIYGIMTEQSIGRLFVAGILPGILLTLLFLLSLYVYVSFKPDLAPRGQRFSWKERIASVKGILGMIVLFILVLGGLYLGIVTAVEAGILGVAGAFIVGLLRRTLTWRSTWQCLWDTIMITGSIMIIFVGGMTFLAYLGIIGFSKAITGGIAALAVSPTLLLLVILAIYLILGMFLEPLTMIVLTIPIFYPAVKAVGIDPIHFAVLFVISIQIGLVTPPVGMNVFVTHGVIPDVSIAAIFKRIYPFVIAELVTVLIIVFFPVIATFLPSRMTY